MEALPGVIFLANIATWVREVYLNPLSYAKQALLTFFRTREKEVPICAFQAFVQDNQDSQDVRLQL